MDKPPQPGPKQNSPPQRGGPPARGPAREPVQGRPLDSRAKELQADGWKIVDAPKPQFQGNFQPIQSISNQEFFGTPRLRQLEPAVARLARNPWTVAGLMLLAGFFAVFVQQATFIIQIIAGAPIFEEAFKFGLALILTLTIASMFGAYGNHGRWADPAWAWLGLFCGLLVGGGFGVLEHWVTYSEEDGFSYAWRIAFHGIATATSVIIFYAVARNRDVRTRWFAILPAVVLHAVNNILAVVLFGASFAFSVDVVGMLVSGTVTFILLMVAIVALAAGDLVNAAIAKAADGLLPVRWRPWPDASAQHTSTKLR